MFKGLDGPENYLQWQDRNGDYHNFTGTMGENCDRQWPIEQSDTIILNDPALLPITGVRYGPIKFDQQIAKISISSLQCEPYKDVSLSSRFGELNETVVEIKSVLSSLETNTDKRLNKLENQVLQSTEGTATKSNQAQLITATVATTIIKSPTNVHNEGFNSTTNFDQNDITDQNEDEVECSNAFSVTGKKCLNKCDCYEESFKECMVVDNWWSDEYEPCTPCGKEDDDIQDEGVNTNLNLCEDKIVSSDFHSPATKIGGKCLVFSKMIKKFNDSISACEGVNGRLAEPKNKQINDAYATEAYKVFGNGTNYWFGIRKNGGIWKYASDGQTVPFTNWNTDEPDSDDCVYLGHSSSDHVGNWWDMNCISLAFFVCEI